MLRKDLIRPLMILSLMIFGILIIQDIIYYNLYETIIKWIVIGLLLCSVFSIVGGAFGLKNNRFLEDISFMIALVGMCAFFICLGILIYRVIVTKESLLHLIGLILSIVIYKIV